MYQANVTATDFNRTQLQMVEPLGKQSHQSKYLGRFKNNGSKRLEKANKAIDPDSNYLDQSIHRPLTANRKTEDKSYQATYAIHHISWSLASLAGGTYNFTESHEDKIIRDEAAISDEAEPLSDPYGQIRKGHPGTVEEGILETWIRVEDERSYDVRSHSHVGCFNICSWFDSDDENSFIQASSNALLPDEASPTPLLEVVSIIFLNTQLVDLRN